MKNKELLLKIVISITSIVAILSMIFFGIADKYEQGTEKYQVYVIIAVVLLIVASITAIIMYIMMTKIKIAPKKKASPSRIIISSENYEQFETSLIDELNSNEYSNMIDIPNDLDCSMKYMYKTTFNTLQIFMLLRVNELTENILENYYQCFGKYIKENHKNNIGKDFEIIHCICVDRITPSFKTYIEENAKQPYGRYHLPVGVSFGGRTVYIAPSLKGGFFEVRYYEILKKFKEIIKSQTVDELK